MPTVFRAKGYRFGFFMFDLGEPMHVHVFRGKGGYQCKVWMASLQVVWSHGFTPAELRDIVQLVEAHREEIVKAWKARETK